MTEPKRARPLFNEDTLRAEIVRVWGEYGAHVEVFDMMRRRSDSQPDLLEACELVADLPSLVGLPHPFHLAFVAAQAAIAKARRDSDG